MKYLNEIVRECILKLKIPGTILDLLNQNQGGGVEVSTFCIISTVVSGTHPGLENTAVNLQ